MWLYKLVNRCPISFYRNEEKPPDFLNWSYLIDESYLSDCHLWAWETSSGLPSCLIAILTDVFSLNLVVLITIDQ